MNISNIVDHISLHRHRVEADVFVILDHCDGPTRVYPIWECENTNEELQSFATAGAIDLCEELGGGSCTAHILDFRGWTDEQWESQRKFAVARQSKPN
jgi:hypothetical protein